MLEKWAATGMRIGCQRCPVLIGNPNAGAGAVRGMLQNAFKSATTQFGRRCQMIICIVDGDRHLYQEIKRVTLTEAGVLTQCMLSKNAGNPRAIKDQYAANVALKVNIKLGGATNHVDHLPLYDMPTMVLGADVTYAAPGSGQPSVAAVVSSIDRHATVYHTYLRAMPPRTEMISDLKDMTAKALDGFHKACGVYPQRIVFFRDGVSSGQFKEVREHEIRAMKDALKAKGCHDTKLTFVVVQKRHHIRLFPEDGNKDRSGNCMPGTVIDTDIVHPTQFNFILQSHSGIQGTSRPAIYYVIYDEIQLGSDQMQQLCFNLCYLSERATRSISFVAPSYRAHLAAIYGRMFIDGDISDTGSMRSGGEMPIRLLDLKDPVARTMYYM